MTHQKRNVAPLPKEPQTPLQRSLPLQYFKSSPPSLLSSLPLTQWPPLCPSVSLPSNKLKLLFPNISTAFISDRAFVFQRGVIDLAEHGQWTSTAANAYITTTDVNLLLPPPQDMMQMQGTYSGQEPRSPQ